MCGCKAGGQSTIVFLDSMSPSKARLLCLHTSFSHHRRRANVARGRRSRLAAICQRRLDQHSMKSILPVSPQKRGYLVKRNYEELIELARMCACDSRDGPEVVDEPRRWQRNIRPKPLSQGFIRAAPPFPQHNSASFGGLAYRRCRVLGESTHVESTDICEF